MKKLLLICSSLLVFSQWVSAQVTSISVESVYADDGTIAGYPAGHTTYRVYANLTNANDRLTAVFGDDQHPLSLRVTGGGIWNAEAGGISPIGLYCEDESSNGLALYDSYLTIGAACGIEGAEDFEALEDPNVATWLVENFDTTPYGAGELTVDSEVGGVWFNLPTHLLTQAADSNRVLIAQITTDGSICGTFNFQVFPEYDGAGSEYIEQHEIYFSFVPTLEVTSNVVNPHCSGDQNGSIQVEATGGTGELSYSLDNENFDEFGQWNNLGAGDYTVYINDNAGCLAIEQITISDPEPIQVTFTSSNITCNGANDGEIHITSTGGSGMTIFSLSGEDYIPAPDFSDLGPGEYVIHAMDMYACSYVSEDTIVFTEPEPIVGSLEYEIISCYGANDGEIHLTIEGGEAPYEIHYGNVDTFDNPILNVEPGSYVVTITDARGCEYTFDDWALIGEPTPIAINGLAPVQISESTPGGNTEYTVSGGIFPYTFSWTDPSGEVVSTDANLPQLFGAVAAGVYTLTITDDNGCEFTTTIDVTYLVGMQEHTAIAMIEMYPNPTHGQVQLKVRSAGELQYRIVDASGRTVMAPRTVLASSNEFNEMLDLSHLANGVYFIELKAQRGTEIYRFIKM